MITFILCVLGVLFAMRLLVDINKRFYAAKSSEDEVHFATTKDGWRLSLHRYLPRGDNPHGEPVMLHHGFSASHLAFDLGMNDHNEPVPSLAHWLADRGYDVWSINLRGREQSDTPRWFNKFRYRWSLYEYMEQDDPALVDYILSKSEYENLHWIGHSMGGILLFAYCIEHGSPKVASGVALGSGIDYSNGGSFYDYITPAAGLTKYIERVPLGWLTAFLSLFSARNTSKPEQMNVWPPNVAGKAARAVMANVVNDVSSNVVWQLSEMFLPGGLRRRVDGEPWINKAREASTPMFHLGGDYDRQCTPVILERTYKAFSNENHEIWCAGPDEGCGDHYGHFDLSIGLRAETEIYPRILAFFEKHRAVRKSGKGKTTAAKRKSSRSAAGAA
ncbi:alpha/beta fold hydrolase [bacterium]|nr:alpha/beta fold hydrolase [bacterium]